MPVEKLDFIDKNQKYCHHGDLIVGEVRKGAVLEVIDGSLTVTGDIKSSARVTQKTDNLKKVIKKQRTFNIKYKLKWGEAYVDNVNIDNRIFTDDAASTYREGHQKCVEIKPFIKTAFTDSIAYEGGVVSISFSSTEGEFSSELKKFISSLGTNLTSPDLKCNRLAEATIDGKKYRGKKIIVKGKSVTVDGTLVYSAPEEEIPKDPKLIVKGSLCENVQIDSDAEMSIDGKVGNLSKIVNLSTGLKADQLGDNVTICTFGSINIDSTIGINANLQSLNGDLFTQNIGAHAKINARNKIVAADIGANSQLISEKKGLTAQNLEKNIYISVYGQVNVGNVGDNSYLLSKYDAISAKKVGHHVMLVAQQDISAIKMGMHSKAKSLEGKVCLMDVSPNNTIVLGGPQLHNSFFQLPTSNEVNGSNNSKSSDHNLNSSLKAV